MISWIICIFAFLLFKFKVLNKVRRIDFKRFCFKVFRSEGENRRLGRDYL